MIYIQVTYTVKLGETRLIQLSSSRWGGNLARGARNGGEGVPATLTSEALRAVPRMKGKRVATRGPVGRRKNEEGMWGKGSKWDAADVN